MPFIIAVTQRKGGSGKTTVAVSVAGEFRRRGVDLGLVDADPQGSSLAWAMPGRLRFPVYAAPLENTSVTQWSQSLLQFRHKVLVIDTSPQERLVAAAVTLASITIIPCTPSGLDLEATDITLRIVDAVRARSKRRQCVIVVPNRIDVRLKEGQQIADELESFGELVGPPLGDRMSFIRAFSAGETVADFDPNSEADQEAKALCDFIEQQYRRNSPS